jgi:RNA polymerase sigma-70 factor (ECF subfamily)
MEMDMQKVYIENRQSVFNHVMFIVKNHHDSEEVTNDVFLKMIRMNEKPQTAFNADKSALTTWIRTITHSVILDYFRTNHQSHYKAVSDLISDGQGEKDENKVYYQFVAPKSTQSDELVLTSEIKGKVDAAINKLDMKNYKVAILYFLWEYEYHEIAAILNVPMGTVKGMIYRIRAILQGSLKEVYSAKV